MSYHLERVAINNWFQSNSFFGLTPFRLNSQAGAAVAGGGYLTITNGSGRIGSTGAPSNNLHSYAGIASVVLWGADEPAARILADAVVAGLTNTKLDQTGAAVTPAATVVINFAAQGFVPFIQSAEREGELFRILVQAPFQRTERK